MRIHSYLHLVTDLVIYGFQLITVKLTHALPIFLFPVFSPIPLFLKAYFLVHGFHFPKCFLFLQLGLIIFVFLLNYPLPRIDEGPCDGGDVANPEVAAVGA